MVFGYIDEDRFEGEIDWHPVVSKEFWDLELEEIYHNGVSLNLCHGATPRRNCKMTPDSGTTFLTMPT